MLVKQNSTLELFFGWSLLDTYKQEKKNTYLRIDISYTPAKSNSNTPINIKGSEAQAL